MTRVAVWTFGFGRRVGYRGPKSLCVIMGTWSLPASRPFALYKSCHCVRMRGKPHRTRWPLRGMCQHTATRGTQCAAPRRTAQEACPALVSRRDRLARHPCEHPCIEQKWHTRLWAGLPTRSLVRPQVCSAGPIDNSDIWMSHGDRPHNRGFETGRAKPAGRVKRRPGGRSASREGEAPAGRAKRQPGGQSAGREGEAPAEPRLAEIPAQQELRPPETWVRKVR